MSKFILSIAVIALLATAGLGYFNYHRYEMVIAAKNKKIEKLQHSEESLSIELTSSKQQLQQQSSSEEKDKKDLQAIQQDQQSTKATLAEVQKQLADAMALITEQKNDLAVKDETIQQLQQQQSKQPPSSSGKSTKGSSSLRKELEETQAKLKAAEAQIQEFKQRELDQKKKLSNGGLEGKVLAVNNTWNFIVINLGDENGVNKGSEMSITRANQVVAKVKISSVEPLTSIADIIPESLQKGASIQAGDTVVYSNSENSQQK